MGVIVVGVDGSEPAAQAALAAARLGAALGSELRIVCAYGRSEPRDEAGEAVLALDTRPDNARRNAAQAADAAISRIRSFYPSLIVTAHLAAGRPSAALLSAAEEFDAELIVVGNKNVQGASRLLGSVAKEVAKRARCDLYVAHTHPRT
jgi:nucleotide-binding universal stress UspA family protein